VNGYLLFHNCVKPHESLGGRTPSEAAGVKVEGENKWITLLQNAKRSPKVNTENPMEDGPST
jgi:putative transposase